MPATVQSKVLRLCPLRPHADCGRQLYRDAATSSCARLRPLATRAPAAVARGTVPGLSKLPPRVWLLHCNAQAAAAAELLEVAKHEDGWQVQMADAHRAHDALLARSQRVALDALTRPIADAMQLVHSLPLVEVWRGHGALHGSGGRASSLPSERDEIAAAMLAFSATPQAYITQVGEHLLALPQQLEPFESGPTLTRLWAIAAVAGGKEGSGGEEDFGSADD